MPYAKRKIKASPLNWCMKYYFNFSFPIILLSEISQPDYVHVNTCNNVQIMHPNANIDDTGYFSGPFQCKPDMAFF